MSRAIKFRAWDTKLQKMINWNLFIRFEDSEYIIQQFTGLFDSQGKEIYEGDIIKAGSVKGEVNFIDGAYFIDDALLFEANVLLAGNLIILGNIFQNPELLS